MSHLKTITIVGVTGSQGSSVAKTFLESPGWHVRGITRSSFATPAAENLASAGVELIRGNLDDKSSLIDAFRQSHVVFANTDFFALTKYPDLTKLLETTYADKPLNEACFAHEIKQSKNIVDAAAQVLEEGSPLETFVLSSLSHASKWSGGEIVHVLHFDAKAIAENYLKDQHSALAAKTRYLQVGFYMPNVVSPFLLPKRAPDGVFEFRWANIGLSTILPATLPDRDVGLFVEALVAAPANTVLLGESDPITVEGFINAWSLVTGHTSRLVTITTQQLEAVVEPAMPGFGREFAENFQYYRDYTYTGGDPKVLRPADLGIDPTRLTSFETYLRTVDWDTVLES